MRDLVIEDVVCPQCGGDQCFTDCRCGVIQHRHCLLCGYTIAIITTENNPDSLTESKVHVIIEHRGFGVYFESGLGTRDYYLPLQEPLSPEFEDELFRRSEKPDVDTEGCYLTMWDSETEKLEVVFGEANYMLVGIETRPGKILVCKFCST
jgi:hypothetical protein